jgi:hypothetical protein
LSKPYSSDQTGTDIQEPYLDSRPSVAMGVTTVDAWLRGEIAGVDKAGKLIPSIRGHLLEQAGNKCTRCGWCKPNPVLGHPILYIHRKDGDNRNTSPSNLVVICGNCQTLTPTFGSLNRGVTNSPKSVVSRKKWA